MKDSTFSTRHGVRVAAHPGDPGARAPRPAPGDRLLTAFLNLGNWRARTWAAACAVADVVATPHDGRHTYASLRILEGDSPLLRDGTSCAVP